MTWNALFGPRNLPQDNRAERTPMALAELLRSEVARWGAVLKQTRVDQVVIKCEHQSATSASMTCSRRGDSLSGIAMLQTSNRAPHIDPPASSCAIMRRACPTAERTLDPADSLAQAQCAATTILRGPADAVSQADLPCAALRDDARYRDRFCTPRRAVSGARR